jgi:hypothetical protein
MDFKFPNASSRVSICGATGSGKTRFGVWLFGMCSDFKKRPYIIFDFKGDDLIAQIDRAEEIDLKANPKHPGLYIVRPQPDMEAGVDDFLWRVWQRGNTGLFFDEGYMISPRSRPYNAILTQGRSLKIPTMTLTQRPVMCSRFVFSEAGFFAVFRMNDQRDYDTLRGFTPQNDVFNYYNRLPPFTARWYDVARDYSAFIDPVPDDENTLDIFDRALARRKRGL